MVTRVFIIMVSNPCPLPFEMGCMVGRHCRYVFSHEGNSILRDASKNEPNISRSRFDRVAASATPIHLARVQVADVVRPTRMSLAT